MEYKIIIIKVDQREEAASGVQSVLTEFGCSIKVRLGLHDIPNNTCSPSGLIFLQVVDEEKTIKKMIDKLNGINNVSAKYLTI
ncbi:MAG: hypothetical protein RBT69_08870 [Spirochaetia bacterium]|nr:hypothetical protein [Spirochaetia bacterium]